MTMTNLLTPERVLPRLRARGPAMALRGLAAQIARDAKISVDVILHQLLGASDLLPLMPLDGVSLLHTLLPHMEHPMAAFARLETPLNLGAPDGCSTDIAVLLASPSAEPRDHLRALACIARRLRRQDVLDLLRGADNRDTMFIALTSNEWCTSESQNRSPHRVSASH
jgi:nitrogen PTS system EIIA component